VHACLTYYINYHVFTQLDLLRFASKDIPGNWFFNYKLTCNIISACRLRSTGRRMCQTKTAKDNCNVTEKNERRRNSYVKCCSSGSLYDSIKRPKRTKLDLFPSVSCQNHSLHFYNKHLSVDGLVKKEEKTREAPSLFFFRHRKDEGSRFINYTQLCCHICHRERILRQHTQHKLPRTFQTRHIGNMTWNIIFKQYCFSTWSFSYLIKVILTLFRSILHSRGESATTHYIFCFICFFLSYLRALKKMWTQSYRQ